jgi:Rap1a immunity proteins
MKKTMTAIALVAGLAATQEAHAEMLTSESTGWQLYNYCQADAALCGTYLAGVWGGYIESVKIARALHPERRTSTLFCPTSAVPGEQLREVYLSYAATHPAQLTYAAGDEAIVAMATAFPCHQG